MLTWAKLPPSPGISNRDSDFLHNSPEHILSSAASLANPELRVGRLSSPSFQEACSVMLNWPRVACSSSASMLAFCSKWKLVMRGDDSGFVTPNHRYGSKSRHVAAGFEARYPLTSSGFVASSVGRNTIKFLYSASMGYSLYAASSFSGTAAVWNPAFRR